MLLPSWHTCVSQVQRACNTQGGCLALIAVEWSVGWECLIMLCVLSMRQAGSLKCAGVDFYNGALGYVCVWLCGVGLTLPLQLCLCKSQLQPCSGLFFA